MSAVAAMHDDVWDEEVGDWRPDEWDLRARAVIDYRDRVAASVGGPVPAVGTAEWAAADPQVQVAAYARHERDVAAAQGAVISNRMAAEALQRRDDAEARQAMSAEWCRRRYAHTMLSTEERSRRASESAWRETQPRPSDGIPAPRRAAEATRECLQRARLEAACAVAHEAAREAVAGPEPERAPAARASGHAEAAVRVRSLS